MGNPTADRITHPINAVHERRRVPTITYQKRNSPRVIPIFCLVFKYGRRLQTVTCLVKEGRVRLINGLISCHVRSSN